MPPKAKGKASQPGKNNKQQKGQQHHFEASAPAGTLGQAPEAANPHVVPALVAPAPASALPTVSEGRSFDESAVGKGNRKPPAKLKGVQKPKAKKPAYIPVAARKALASATASAAASAAATPSIGAEDVAAAPPTVDLSELEHKLHQSLDQLRAVERQIFNLETTYFDSTNPQGNALLGYDGLLSNNGAKKHFKPEDRIFSGSSTTGTVA